MRKLFRSMGDTIKNGEDTVLVTVVASSGSTPRGAGSHMLVTHKGRICGTIGGGAVEYQCEQVAQEVLNKKQSELRHYNLRKNEIQDLGMVCGGDVHVYFTYAPAGAFSIIELTDIIEELFQKGEDCWLISDITLEKEGSMGVYSQRSGLRGTDIPHKILDRLQNKPVQIEADGRTFYCEKLVQAGTVYIFGGGHVAQALVPALTAVNFRCVVLEDREDFCKPELFPGVAETRLIDNENVLNYVNIDQCDYVVIMTRGHKDDQTIQAQVLKTPARYIGVIGSKKKSETVFSNLREMDFTQKDLDRITTPIGLDIKAETPAEIAVSITGQMIMVRAELNSASK